jgi:CRISPR-associated protein Cmr1
MKKATFEFELLTPAFAGGAEPKNRAEIRAPSIRGQLRWWFRVLGGFKKLRQKAIKEQEAEIFGAIAGDEGCAGKLAVRVVRTVQSLSRKDMKAMGVGPFTEEGYLLWPLASRNEGDSSRAVIDAGQIFQLDIVWRGNPDLWDDIRSLVTVFGNLGSLGFRGRRAMGALALRGQRIFFCDALAAFPWEGRVEIKALPAGNAKSATQALGGWLRSWRAHGRTGRNQQEQGYPGYSFAKKDHDTGAALLNGARNSDQPVYRAAIGLPIIQRFSGAGSLNWDKGSRSSKGRFASPVLLRPHRSEANGWSALVIFIEALRWPDGERVHISTQRDEVERRVSLDLYDAMKSDRRLGTFPPAAHP